MSFEPVAMRSTFRSLGLAGVGALTLLSGPTFAQPVDNTFTPLTPCRVVDSRQNLGISGPLLPGQVRPVIFRGKCGIPDLTTNGGREANQAIALALNVVAVSPTGDGHIVGWPSNKPVPVASIINFTGGQNIANGVIVPMCDQNMVGPCASGDISFLAGVSTVHLVVDVTGYYSKPALPGNSRFGAGPGPDNLLCVNTAFNVRFGLSYRMADSASAQLLCPAGTWLCSRLERGFVNGITCNTTRGDTDCDAIDCAGNCIDAAENNHRGWTQSDGALSQHGETFNEDGLISSNLACELRPAWCCSRND
jgi:hypothetical protein